MSKNDIFFEKKKEWSLIKDQILACYLEPYMNKILMKKEPVRYIDTFAGEGKFEDGTEGSPLIAIHAVQNALEVSKSGNHDVRLFFIEKYHIAQLLNAVSGYEKILEKPIHGAFESDFIPLARKLSGTNLFCYIDPFGLKILDCALLEELSAMQFSSIEILVNFSAFGLFRWACGQMSIKIDKDTIDAYKDVVDDEPYESFLSIDRVLGTDKWKMIITNYRDHLKNGYDSVEEIATLYKELLLKHFGYVVKIPIRLKEGGKAQYHMFFATNHIQGATLMGDVMGKREMSMVVIRNGGMQYLFQDLEDDPREGILSILRDQKAPITLMQLKGLFYTRVGLSRRITVVLRELAEENRIKVVRFPANTGTGKPSTFWTEEKQRKLQIELS